MSSQKDYAHQAPGATGVDPNHPASAHPVVLDHDQAIVQVEPQRKKIAICGFAASSRGLAPWTDPEYEIWGLNQLYRHIPRADRWFDIHENWREDNVEGTDHPAWLAQCGIPVYMTERQPSIPTSVRYPIERIIREVTGLDYETSTVAFMLAMAIHEIDKQVEAEIDKALEPLAPDIPSPPAGGGGRTARRRIAPALPRPDYARDPRKFHAWRRDLYAKREIGIYGIDLIVGTEYDYQKACVEYILGLAQARDITIRIPPQSALLKQLWRYGYEKEPQAYPIRLTELQKRQQAIQKEREQLIARLNTLDGASQENGYWQQVADLRLKGGQVKLNEDT